MRNAKMRLAALALTSGLMLGGCAYGIGDPYGSGVSIGYGSGYGYGGYPYGGYGYGGYPYGGYGYGYNPYGPYGSYYGSPYYGWYNGWYYPGTGYYVYDRDRRRRTITEAERQYWREKFDRYRSQQTTTSGAKATTSSIEPRANWSGFKRDRTRSSETRSSERRASSRGFERSSSARSSDSSSRSSRSDDRSSDFMRRHGPGRSKD